MYKLNEQVVLDYYVELLETDKIDFLVKTKQQHEKMKQYIRTLRNEVSMNKKIQSAKELWKLLFSSAMSYIDPNQSGYDKLFNYFDEYVEFEELIFASDSFYRDHTLHCLWVYFLGIYIRTHEEFSDLIKITFNQENDYQFISILLKYNQDNEIGSKAVVIKEILDLMKVDIKNDQAIFCISALTHDLGYPLKKINKINKSIKKILPCFGIDNFNEFDFTYNSTQQHFNERFLDILTYNIQYHVEMSLSKNEDISKEILENLFIPDSSGKIVINIEALSNLPEDIFSKICSAYEFTIKEVDDYPMTLRYSDDLENYQHGIMSAFLLMKTVDAFRQIELVVNKDKTADKKSIHKNFARCLSKQKILQAISDHTSKGYRIQSISEHSQYLAFIDELEEFSRISRANQNREFINEFCSTNIYRKNDYLMIDFTFDNEEIANLDPELAFKGRCKKLLSLFDIENLDKELKIKLSCIGNLPYDKNHYMIEIRHKFAKITINEEEKDIPSYLKSNDFMSRMAYEKL